MFFGLCTVLKIFFFFYSCYSFNFSKIISKIQSTLPLRWKSIKFYLFLNFYIIPRVLNEIRTSSQPELWQYLLYVCKITWESVKYLFKKTKRTVLHFEWKPMKLFVLLTSLVRLRFNKLDQYYHEWNKHDFITRINN